MKSRQIETNLNEYDFYEKDSKQWKEDLVKNLRPFKEVILECIRAKRKEDDKNVNQKNFEEVKNYQSNYNENKDYSNRNFNNNKPNNSNYGNKDNYNYSNNNNKGNYNNHNNYNNKSINNNTNTNCSTINKTKIISNNHNKIKDTEDYDNFDDIFEDSVNITHPTNNTYNNYNINSDNNNNYNNNKTINKINDQVNSHQAIISDAIQTRNTKNYKIAEKEKWSEPFEWDRKAQMNLLKYYAYNKFRPNQKEIINAVMSDKDVFVCMPTGGGKSLCFQIPALMKKGITIVIMPLISLIFDQYTQLTALGINCVSTKNDSIKEIIKKLSFDNDGITVKLLLTTPEKIVQSNEFKRLLNEFYNDGLISRFVIDEAHCLSKWGNEFRKDYLELSYLRRSYPKVPLLALTATAPIEVREDVINKLGFVDGLFFKQSYNRENLMIIIKKKQDKEAAKEISEIINKQFKNKSGIVYCSTKDNCENLTASLKKSGINCAYYHAGMNEELRNDVQHNWKNDEILVIVATCAFGMGINKNDVRFVIHQSLPSSYENYYQEIGRAGRDGEKATCFLFYNFADKKTLEYLQSKHDGGTLVTIRNYRRINQILDFCEDNITCRRKNILKYFDEDFDEKKCKKMCDCCASNTLSSEIVENNYSAEADIILKMARTLLKRNLEVTSNQLATICLGNKDKNKSIQNFMSSSEFDKDLISKLNINADTIKVIIRRLLISEYLDEKPKSYSNKHLVVRIALGKKYLDEIAKHKAKNRCFSDDVLYDVNPYMVIKEKKIKESKNIKKIKRSDSKSSIQTDISNNESCIESSNDVDEDAEYFNSKNKCVNLTNKYQNLFSGGKKNTNNINKINNINAINNKDNFENKKNNKNKKEKKDIEEIYESEYEDINDFGSYYEDNINQNNDINDFYNNTNKTNKNNKQINTNSGGVKADKTNKKNKGNKKKDETINEYGLLENKALFKELYELLKQERKKVLKRINKERKELRESMVDNNKEILNYDLKELSTNEIFTDNGLRELAKKLPTSINKLRSDFIFGVGESLLTTYGPFFLPIINEFISIKNIKLEDDGVEKAVKKQHEIMRKSLIKSIRKSYYKQTSNKKKINEDDLTQNNSINRNPFNMNNIDNDDNDSDSNSNSKSNNNSDNKIKGDYNYEKDTEFQKLVDDLIFSGNKVSYEEEDKKIEGLYKFIKKDNNDEETKISESNYADFSLFNRNNVDSGNKQSSNKRNSITECQNVAIDNFLHSSFKKDNEIIGINENYDYDCYYSGIEDEDDDKDINKDNEEEIADKELEMLYKNKLKKEYKGINKNNKNKDDEDLDVISDEVLKILEAKKKKAAFFKKKYMLNKFKKKK